MAEVALLLSSFPAFRRSCSHGVFSPSLIAVRVEVFVVPVDQVASAISAVSESEFDSLVWLQSRLRTAIEGVMAADGDAIRKANSLARLAGHYLKTCQVKELKQALKQLTTRVAELEQAMEAPARLGVVGDERSAAGEAGGPLRENSIEAGQNGRGATPPAPSATYSPSDASLPTLTSTADSGESTRAPHRPLRHPTKRKRK
jgi:hypothetical protein